MLAQVIEASPETSALPPTKWRRERGLTQAQAAEMAGLEKRRQGMWSRWERGECEPPLAVIVRIEAESGGGVTAESWAQVRAAFLARKREQAESQAQGAAIARVLGPEPKEADSPDGALLALAPTFEAAATAYLAYDRDLDVTPRDPDYAEAQAHHACLHATVSGAADRIFAHAPRTMPGLLLVAHAAAVMAEEGWEAAEAHVDHDGRLLRYVANGLFRLAGIDWRGRLLPFAGPLPENPQRLAPDAALLALAEAAIAEERAAKARSSQPDDAPPGVFARSRQLLERVVRTSARTPVGLAARARVLLEHLPEVDPWSHDDLCEELGLSIARDAARLWPEPDAAPAPRYAIAAE